MKEASAIFQDGFKVGLNPDPTLNTQAEYLTECYNMVPGAYGIEPRKEVFEPPAVFADEKFPYPAVFCTSRYKLIFTKKALYLADSQWLVTKLGNIEVGSIPHIADFLDTVIISGQKGQWIIKTLLEDGVTKLYTNLGGASFKTCCNFRGQLIIGNCSLPKGPRKEMCPGDPSYDQPVGNPLTVAWSKIGSLEWEYTLGNEVGWAPMAWQGEVWALVVLGKEIVVYGSNGIAKLIPQKDPVTTFGVEDFGDIGLLNRNCVAGDLSHHLFLGTDYNLYLIEPEKPLSGEGKTPKRLGYAHLMKSLRDPIITFDPAFSQWWIGDEEKCYVFTGAALGEASVTPTSLNRLDGTLWGYLKRHGSNRVYIETSPITFNSKGIKTLMNVEADVESGQNVYGQVSWKSDYHKEFKKNRRILLDPRGSFFPILGGTEFKIGLESGNYQDFLLSKLWLHFKNTDKTFSRGVINAGRPPE